MEEEPVRKKQSRLARIGIYGGAFDPVHFGHLAVARAAFTGMTLDRLLFVPTVMPPHKTDRTRYKHRLAMLRLALAELADRHFFISTIEEELPVPSYTINTLTALRQSEGEYFFILGVDAFVEIESWQSWQQILSLVNIVVSPRKGYAVEQLYQLLARLGYRFTGDFFHYYGKDLPMKDIFLLQDMPPEISSSDIKTALQNNGNSREKLQLLPRAVASYILSHNLYGITR